VNYLYAIPVKTVMDEIRQLGYHDVLTMATYWHAVIVAESTSRSHASILQVYVWGDFHKIVSCEVEAWANCSHAVSQHGGFEDITKRFYVARNHSTYSRRKEG
jgi:hypothetical protein